MLKNEQEVLSQPNSSKGLVWTLLKSIHKNGWSRARNRPTGMLNCFFTKMQKQYNGGRIAFSSNGAGATGHS